MDEQILSPIRPSFEAVYEQYYDRIYHYAYTLLRKREDAEDVTEETFLAAYRHWNEFDGKNEKAWLCRIAGNKCIDWKRRAVRKEEATEEEVLMEQPSEEREPLQEILCREVTQKLAESCKSLSPPYDETAESYFLKVFLDTFYKPYILYLLYRHLLVFHNPLA